MRQRDHRRFVLPGLLLAALAVLLLLADGVHVHTDHGSFPCWLCQAGSGLVALAFGLTVGGFLWVLLGRFVLAHSRLPELDSTFCRGPRSPPL
ncbi:MAG: hypothetical protein AB1792_10835 [Candidatus Zixiibacteriota bacterium]